MRRKNYALISAIFCKKPNFVQFAVISALVFVDYAVL
jgi:hypothetical protein